jgi:hypothetical protein
MINYDPYILCGDFQIFPLWGRKTKQFFFNRIFELVGFLSMQNSLYIRVKKEDLKKSSN